MASARACDGGAEETPACWICLDEGPDESGEPLLRDCSCRGSSGFIHLDCVVEYAEQKFEVLHGRGEEWVSCSPENPWHYCPNCHQEYENELGRRIADKCLAYMEKNHPDDHGVMIQALFEKMRKCSHDTEKGEVSRLAKEIISAAEEFKRINGLVGLVDGRLLFLEGHTYKHLGLIAVLEGTLEGAEKAVECFEKFRDISLATGADDSVLLAEELIARAKSSFEGSNVQNDSGDTVGKYRSAYRKRVESNGVGSAYSMSLGMRFGVVLRDALHSIEAERLVAKIAASSNRIHGPDHSVTKNANSLLEMIRRRIASISTPSCQIYVEVLRLEQGGEKCTVRGPFAGDRDANKEKTFIVEVSDLFPTMGSPVVCIGLRNATHLNGKIGDVRHLHDDGRYEVHFEDVSLKPNVARVKPENVRLVVDLPPKDDGE